MSHVEDPCHNIGTLKGNWNDIIQNIVILANIILKSKFNIRENLEELCACTLFYILKTLFYIIWNYLIMPRNPRFQMVVPHGDKLDLDGCPITMRLSFKHATFGFSMWTKRKYGLLALQNKKIPFLITISSIIALSQRVGSNWIPNWNQKNYKYPCLYKLEK